MDIIGNLKISIFLVLIILLAVFTRYYNLNKNPGFYGDECCYGEVGYNLVRGKLQYEGIKPTFFSTFMTQPPVFPVIAGFFSFILGKSILITRVISALSSLMTVLLLFLITREMGAKRGGICAILFFILHPKTLLINRYGFTYNLGMVFLLATLFFAIKYSRTKTKKY